MIDVLISSKTRVKLLLKFFLNSHATSYLRSLESEFGESTNAIRLELNRLEKAGLLLSESESNRKVFRANTQHPLFGDIHQIVLKQVGLDRVIENIAQRLGNLQSVLLTGDFSKGIDGPVIDLIFIGEIDKNYLSELIDKTEKLMKRKIKYLIYTPDEAMQENWKLYKPEPLILWTEK